MREFNLRDIHNPDIFQEFCEQLLSQEFPDFRPIDDTNGDKGCDGLAQNDELFFQVYFPEANRYNERMAGVRRKIASNLKKLHPPFPKQWILVTVDKVSIKIHEYCRKKEKEYGNMRILIWSEPNLKPLLDKYQSLKERWIKRIYGDSIQVIQPEAITYSQRNNIPNLLEFDKQLGTSLSSWEHGDILKQVHTYDSTGKASVALVPKDITAKLPISFTVLMRFDNNTVGQQKYNEFIEAQKNGKEFELEERFIDKATLQINNRKIQEFIPSAGGKAVMKLSPVSRPPLDAYIDFFKQNKIRIQRISNLKLKITNINDEISQLDNYSQETERIKIRICINTKKPQQKSDFSITIDDKCLDAVEGFRCAEFLLNSVRSSTIKLYLNNRPNPLVFKIKQEIPTTIKKSYEYSKMLQDIQDAVGYIIPSIFSAKIDLKDAETIETIHKIVMVGIVEYGKGTFSVTLNNKPVEPFKKLLNDKGISFKLVSEPVEAILLGKKIQLGHKITYFDGIIKEDCKDLLNSAIQRGNIEGIKIVFQSREIDQPTVDLYPNWIKDSDKKIKEFENKRWEKAKMMIGAQIGDKKHECDS